MELIYSSEHVKNAGGRRVVNPRHFAGVEKGVTAVFINGNYPIVRKAYERAGVKVSSVAAIPAIPERKQSSKQAAAPTTPATESESATK